MNDQHKIHQILSPFGYRAQRNWMTTPNRLLDGLSPQNAIKAGFIRQTLVAAQSDAYIMRRNPAAIARAGLPRPQIKQRRLHSRRAKTGGRLW